MDVETPRYILSARALYDYAATQPDELPLRRGDVLEILDKEDDPWWTARNASGKLGLIPKNYVNEILPANETDLPKGWKMSIDPKSGDAYFYNKNTGETQWENPSPSKTKNSARRRKSSVKSDWQQFKDVESGDYYYYNAKTGVTQWEAPSSFVEAHQNRADDLDALRSMRETADRKINALRDAISSYETTREEKSPALQKQPLTASHPHLPQPAVNGSTDKKQLNQVSDATASSHPKKQSNHLTMKDISILIEEKIGKVLAEHDDKLLQRVHTLMKESLSKANDNDAIENHKQQKKQKKEHAKEKSALPTITRSADSKSVPSNITTSDLQSPVKPIKLPPTVSSSNAKSPRDYPETLSSPSENILPSIHKIKKQNIEDLNLPLAEAIPGVDKHALLSSRSTKGDQELVLDYIFGYVGEVTTRSSRISNNKNVVWLHRDVICYPAASVVVMMNVETMEQSFYRGHSDEVTCLCSHPQRKLVGSGQLGRDGRILIWEYNSLLPIAGCDKAAEKNILRELQLKEIHGVNSIHFSGDGRLLMVMGMDETHTISIFDWANGSLLTSTKLGHVTIHQLGFNPYLFHSGDDEKVEKECCYTMLTCGTRHIKFWTLRKVQVRTDLNIVKASGFKGRQMKVPKNKQQFEWKYIIEGNVGLFPKKYGANLPDITCYSIVHDDTLTSSSPRILAGASNGYVYIWQQLEGDGSNAQMWQPKGKLLSIVTDVHDGIVYDVDYHSNRVVTCGKDGMTNIWLLNAASSDRSVVPMEHISAFNVSHASSTAGQPRTVSWNSGGDSVVLGTTSNCLCLLFGEGLTTGPDDDTPNSNIYHDFILHSHISKIKRIAAHPIYDIFATVSTDKTLRIWSAIGAREVAITRLTDCATCVAFTPDGLRIAIGSEEGEIILLSCSYLDKYAELNAEPDAQNVAQWEILGRKSVGPKMEMKKGKGKKSEVVELKYSPDGEYLAVSTRDRVIQLLAVQNGYKRAGVCRGHSSIVMHFDFSVDGSVLQSCDASEMLYWEVPSGKQISSSSSVKDGPWQSWTCPVGWAVQGILNAVDGSHNDVINAVDRSHSGTYLCAAGGSNSDSRSSLKLFKYPVLSDAVPKEYGGHVTGIQDVCFLTSDRYVVTGGGNDACLFLWKHNFV